jgi:hypothetical protein
MICKKCAKEIPDNSVFCSFCGATVATPTVGSIIPFAGYDWRVLDVKDGKALLISEKVLEARPYNDEDKGITWAECTLRAYLNGDFFNSLGPGKARISETQTVNRNNPEYGTPGGADTSDKIFLLSIDEARAYFKDDEALLAYDLNGAASWWWLRSPGSNGGGAANVIIVGFLGVRGSSVDDDNGGVRPALWLNL